MLYPQSNPYRQRCDLNGFWDFRFDPQDTGQQDGWSDGFTHGQPIAVPASWNEQLAECRDNLGPAWYQQRFDLPWGWQVQHFNMQTQPRICLRFGSVNYLAEAWLNGKPIGGHEGGHLPFEFDITDQVRAEGNLLVVRVDGRLAPDQVPPGNVTQNPADRFAFTSYPDTSFDFFPFCGIHRPVVLTATPLDGIEDITVTTEIEGTTGLVRVGLAWRGDSLSDSRARFTLSGSGFTKTIDRSLTNNEPVVITVPEAALWAPGAPNLYDLTVELLTADKVCDRYTLPIGIRTICVEGDALLLNGKPVWLRGFGRHEDFPVAGRGFLPPVVIKDYELLRWIGANSFRTSHYPYSEEMMQLADRLGFLVIDEIPAVGLFFNQDGLSKRQALCRQDIRELITRDKNHPSVVMWSLANEPHSLGGEAVAFFRDLYDLANSLDATRPVTLVSHLGVLEESFDFLDLVCLNRYAGWYTQTGQLDEGCLSLAAELDVLHGRFSKPVLLTEFGADAVPGMHANPPEMFSEEYQAEMLTRQIELCAARSFVVGTHIWNLCDFKTGQAVHRVGGINYKGVFTRDRRPKLAAHRIKEIWGK